MTLVIELPDRQEAALKAKARAQGVPAEEYASHVLAEVLEKENPAKAWDGLSVYSTCAEESRDPRPIWEIILDNMKDVPREEFARLPTDGAAEVDHYLYGHPKRNA